MIVQAIFPMIWIMMKEHKKAKLMSKHDIGDWKIMGKAKQYSVLDGLKFLHGHTKYNIENIASASKKSK